MLAFSKNRHIYTLDLNSTSYHPKEVYQKPDWGISKFAITGDGAIYFVNASGYKEIRKAAVGANSGTDTLYYQHPTYIRNVEVRQVNGGSRVYFSTVGPGGLDAIYYLSDEKSPVEYYIVNPDDIKLYNWCTGKEDWSFYAGDFAFGDDDTLYISNGNSSPCGVYRITGAVEEGVIGSVERIYSSDESICGLAYENGYLYFRRLDTLIWRLNLNTLKEELVYDTPNTTGAVEDVAIFPDQMSGMLPKPDFFNVRIFRWLWFLILRVFGKNRV